LTGIICNALEALIRFQLFKAKSNNDIQKSVQRLLNLIGTGSAIVQTAAASSLKILIGKDYSFVGRATYISIVDTLSIIDGCIDILTQPDGVPKVARQLGYFIGNSIMFYSSKNSSNSSFSRSSKAKDPIDYSRLNIEKSYLRSLYEFLKGSCDANFDFLLDTLIDADVILPPVDWTFIDPANFGKEKALRIFKFISKQVCFRSASSIVDLYLQFMTTMIEKFSPNECSEQYDILCSPLGIGKLFDLAGFGNLNEFAVISTETFKSIVSPFLRLMIRCEDNNRCNGLEGLKQIENQFAKESSNIAEYYDVLCEAICVLYRELSSSVDSNVVAEKITYLMRILKNSNSSQDLLIRTFKCCAKDSWALNEIVKNRPELVTTFMTQLYDTAQLEKYRTSMFYLTLSYYRARNDYDGRFISLVKILDLVNMATSDSSSTFAEFCWTYFVILAFYLSHDEMANYQPAELQDWTVLIAAASNYFFDVMNKTDIGSKHRQALIVQFKALESRVSRGSIIAVQLGHLEALKKH
jgi:hypothetical protein